jgi:hypothetical protein
MRKIETKEHATWYLAGLFDGEGSVRTGGDKGKNTRIIRITNTDDDLINSACCALDFLDIKYKVYQRKARKENWKDYKEIYITRRKERDKFYLLIPTQSSEKENKLKQNYQEYKTTRREDWPIEDVIKMYEEGMSITKIAKIFNRTPPCIHYWLKTYNIETRKIGWQEETHGHLRKND